jgi:hypothetical protein
MKKILTLTTAILLLTGFAYADKGKDKGKKPKAVKTCSGKECGKKKG